MIIGFGPGGGYDLWARTVARHIGKHLPGNPTVAPENMQGAGSYRAANFIYSVAPKDGTVMTIFNPGLVTQSIVQPDKVNLDFRQYAWVGVITPDFRVCYGYGPNGVKSWDDMMHRKEFILGSTGKDYLLVLNRAPLRSSSAMASTPNWRKHSRSRAEVSALSANMMARAAGFCIPAGRPADEVALM